MSSKLDVRLAHGCLMLAQRHRRWANIKRMATCTSGLTHILTILIFCVFYKFSTQALFDKRAKCLDQSHSQAQGDYK